MLNHDEEIIIAGLLHSGRLKNIFPQVIDEFLRGRTFQDAADQSVAISGVVELRSRFGDQGIVSKELKRLPHAGEVPRAVFRHVAFSVGIVVADAAEVSEQFPRGNGPLFLRKLRTIFLHRGIQVQLAVLPELQNRRGGNGFGNGSQAKERRRGRRRKIFQIGHAKTLRPARFAFEDDRSRKAWDAVCRHKAGDGVFDRSAFVHQKVFLLRGKRRDMRGNQDAKKDGTYPGNVFSKPRTRNLHEITSEGSLSPPWPGPERRSREYTSKTVNTGPAKNR